MKILFLILILISINNEVYSKTTKFFKYEKIKFSKNSIGHKAKIKKIRIYCSKNSSNFWSLIKCYENKLGNKNFKNPFSNLNYEDHIYNQLAIQFLLIKLEIIDEQEAFNNFDSFLKSGKKNNNKKEKELNLKNISNCSNNSFYDFSKCLSENFRKWNVYNNSAIHNKIVFEQIVAFVQILVQKEYINLENILIDTEKKYWLDNALAYSNYHYLKYSGSGGGRFLEEFMNQNENTYYLYTDQDGYNFINLLIENYSSEKYRKYIEKNYEENFKWRETKIEDYNSMNFLEKLDYRVSEETIDKTFDFIDIAVGIYHAHSLMNGKFSSSEKKLGLSNDTGKNLKNTQGQIFKSNPQSILNKTFQYNSNSVLNKKWFKFHKLF